MTAVPDIGFFAAPVCVGAVGELSLVLYLPVGPIVTGEDDKRVAREPGIIQRFHDATERVIDSGDKIPICSGLRFTPEPFFRNPGCVGCGQGQIQEEGL